MNVLKQKLLKYATFEQQMYILQHVRKIGIHKHINSSDYIKLNFKLLNNNSLKKNLNGGFGKYNNKSGDFEIDLDNNTYHYKIDRYSPEGEKEFKIIDLITIKEKYRGGIIECGSIQIDLKKKTANILSLGNSNKCLESKLNNVNFKFGDIIFQIMIHICKKENVIKIELVDNSGIKCNGYSLNLSYLKTITHGVTHYRKYGFKLKNELDEQIARENHDIYMSDPQITKKKLLKLILTNANKEIIEKLIKSINEIDKPTISIRKFTKLMLDLNDEYSCELIYKIYINLFSLAGYKAYHMRDYELLLV